MNLPLFNYADAYCDLSLMASTPPKPTICLKCYYTPLYFHDYRYENIMGGTLSKSAGSGKTRPSLSLSAMKLIYPQGWQWALL